MNGGDAQRVWFSFYGDNFWNLTFYTTLKAGENTLTFSSQELPDFDGTTYISDTNPDIDLRSEWAPNIDQLTVTPFTVLTDTTTSAVLAPKIVQSGKSVKAIVRMTGPGGTPSGTVSVTDGTTVGGSATLDKGMAKVALASGLTLGSHELTVTYSGDSAFSSSTDTVTLEVTK